MKLESAKLKERLLESLERLGFTSTSGQVYPPAYSTKESVREMYTAERRKLAGERSDWIDRMERRVLQYFASGDEVNTEGIQPRLEPVVSPLQVDLFRYACLLWSIPVSPGYGRHMRFLLLDSSNNKLIGILGFCDPVYCLAVRDGWIGWSDLEKRLRLWHVMDAYVLGAVASYNYLLGLGNGLFQEVAEFMRTQRPDIFSSYKFGGGPSWKLRVISSCLQELGIPWDILQHKCASKVSS